MKTGDQVIIRVEKQKRIFEVTKIEGESVFLRTIREPTVVTVHPLNDWVKQTLSEKK